MRHRCTRFARARALGLAAALLLAPGCTYLDKYEGFPGTPFTTDQPEGEVTVVGQIEIGAIEKDSKGCVPGGTLFWGNARNTGDENVSDVMIHIEAFTAGGASLGTYAGNVFNGTVDVDDTDPDNPLVRAHTSLEVDQSGTFSVCSPLPFGSVARTEYRTSFVIIDVVE